VSIWPAVYFLSRRRWWPKRSRKLEAANRRYLESLSVIEDPRNSRGKLDKLSQTVQNEGRSYLGFNSFDTDDEALFSAIARGSSTWGHFYFAGKGDISTLPGQ
jgi:hypothetical protein